MKENGIKLKALVKKNANAMMLIKLRTKKILIRSHHCARRKIKTGTALYEKRKI